MVNINPAYRAHELEYVLKQAGISVLIASLAHKTSDYRAMVGAGARRAAPRCAPSTTSATRSWDALLAAAARRDGRATRGARGGAVAATTRSTSSTPRAPPASPRGPRSPTTTSSTTVTSWGRWSPTPSRTGSACPCPSTTASAWSWATSAPPRTAPASSSPRPSFEPGGHAARRPAGALHLALRRAHDVHRGAGPPRLRLVRPVLAAHRDHGGIALPGRGDEAGRRRDAHGGGVHLLRHDGDLAGLHADPAGRRPGAPHRHGRPGAAAHRGEGRRPGDRRDPAARRRPASCAPAATA